MPRRPGRPRKDIAQESFSEPTELPDENTEVDTEFEDDKNLEPEMPEEGVVPLVVSPEIIETKSAKKVKDIPVAVPSQDILAQVTATAKKTCVKYVGGWRHLVAGKPLTAPTEVIKILREKGFVE